MSWRDTFSLLRAVRAVRCGRAERIVVPAKFKVWREGYIVMVALRDE